MRALLRRRWYLLVAPVILGALAVLLPWLRGGAPNGGLLGAAAGQPRARGVLRVGMDMSFPPFEVADEQGTPRGFDVDLAQEIGRRLGYDVQFVNVSFDGLYDALQARHCDILISALPYEAERTRDVSYTGGYFNAGQVIVSRQDDTRVSGPADLASLRVAVEMGSQAHLEARRLHDQQGVALKIVTADSSDEALDLVRAGQADAAIVDGIAASAALHKGGLAIRGKPLTDESFVIAVRRDNPGLFNQVNAALNTLRGEGWLDKLADKWL